MCIKIYATLGDGPAGGTRVQAGWRSGSRRGSSRAPSASPAGPLRISVGASGAGVPATRLVTWLGVTRPAWSSLRLAWGGSRLGRPAGRGVGFRHADAGCVSGQAGGAADVTLAWPGRGRGVVRLPADAVGRSGPSRLGQRAVWVGVCAGGRGVVRLRARGGGRALLPRTHVTPWPCAPLVAALCRLLTALLPAVTALSPL